MPRTTTSLIESIGVSLPNRRVSTREILDGCKNRVRVPLERVTGIKERPCAGEGVYALDLAMQSVEQCLKRSRHSAQDFDLIVSCSISPYDRENHFSFEPPTSLWIKKEFGCHNALALDISNACAGMWTGVVLADLMIRVGSIQRAIVVSGEYITHLTDAAQSQIISHMDPQLASLTLGDAGVAVALERSPNPRLGFLDLDLYTLSNLSSYCVAKESPIPGHLAVMYTDPVKVTTSVVPLCAEHATNMLEQNQHSLSDVQHIIPHQTSRLTMQDAVKEIAKTHDQDFGDRLVNNLEYRGNTSSNSHFLAIYDTIQNGRIRSNDLVLFSISGSGQSIGSGVYRFDDLPNRMRQLSPLSQSLLTASTKESEDLGETAIPRADQNCLGGHILSQNRSSGKNAGIVRTRGEAVPSSIGGQSPRSEFNFVGGHFSQRTSYGTRGRGSDGGSIAAEFRCAPNGQASHLGVGCYQRFGGVSQSLQSGERLDHPRQGGNRNGRGCRGGDESRFGRGSLTRA